MLLSDARDLPSIKELPGNEYFGYVKDAIARKKK
jgi:hypothetical protein